MITPCHTYPPTRPRHIGAFSLPSFKVRKLLRNNPEEQNSCRKEHTLALHSADSKAATSVKQLLRTPRGPCPRFVIIIKTPHFTFPFPYLGPLLWDTTRTWRWNPLSRQLSTSKGRQPAARAGRANFIDRFEGWTIPSLALYYGQLGRNLRYIGALVFFFWRLEDNWVCGCKEKTSGYPDRTRQYDHYMPSHPTFWTREPKNSNVQRRQSGSLEFRDLAFNKNSSKVRIHHDISTKRSTSLAPNISLRGPQVLGTCFLLPIL